jgi:hypothetical protein
VDDEAGGTRQTPDCLSVATRLCLSFGLDGSRALPAHQARLGMVQSFTHW